MSDSNGRIETNSQREYRQWRGLVEWLESKGFDGFGLKVEPRVREGELDPPLDQRLSSNKCYSGAGRGLFATMKLKVRALKSVAVLS